MTRTLDQLWQSSRLRARHAGAASPASPAVERGRFGRLRSYVRIVVDWFTEY